MTRKPNTARRLATIAKPLKYRVEIGDSQSRIYEIQVRQKPTIEEVKVKFHYPEYLDRADETVTQKDADLTAPQYTVAALEIRPSTAVAEGYLELEGRKLSARVEEEGQLVVIDEVPLVKDGSYTVHLVNSAGHSDPNPRPNRITVRARPSARSGARQAGQKRIGPAGRACRC